LKNENENIKSKLIKAIRPELLKAVKEKNGSDIILGQGRFDTCRLMGMEVSGGPILIRIKITNSK
jgi:hypothetical protein